jgi:N-sulfoglucosamine sulfohydrolase
LTRQAWGCEPAARLLFFGVLFGLISAILTTALAVEAPDSPGPARPNILWISCEDTSPWLGFCGESYARTPHLDQLAREGVHFTSAFVTAPVCSPARFAIITGRYATSMGTQRLRSTFPVPGHVQAFPSALRNAGYYCGNNRKTDYNTSCAQRLIREAWDDNGPRAHWRRRKPGQPFFTVFNLTETHQSRTFKGSSAPQLDASERHDPEGAPVPPYYPPTPEARQTIARVHDCITAMDESAGEILAQLEQDGLKEDTIVFFWSDHGQGIPRGKRTLWDTGLKIPLVVYCPPKYRFLLPVDPGGTCDQLVSMIDMGPTILSILELPIPDGVQGRPFLGKSAVPRKYVFGARDRVDEALDLSRSARDSRYLYVRNFMPDLSWNAPEGYSDQLALRRQITKLAGEGKLNAAQLTYAAPRKPVEALYDTEKDPWQLTNLAGAPEHQQTLERFRKELRKWQIETRDYGFMHEWEAARLCADGRPLSEAARSDSEYPLNHILDTAERIGSPGQARYFTKHLEDPNSTVRYWAVIGLRVAAAGEKEPLRRLLADPSLPVRVEAANVLVARWNDQEGLRTLSDVLRSGNEHAQLHAARTLQMLGEKARPALPVMREASEGSSALLGHCLRPAIAGISGLPPD